MSMGMFRGMVANQWIAKPYLSWSEVKCSCGQCDGGVLQAAIVPVFLAIREEYRRISGADFGLWVSSGVRCAYKNRLVSKSEKSRHIEGDALDIIPTARTPEALERVLPFDVFREICDRANPTGGVGAYPDWRKGSITGGCHIDARGHEARWIFTEGKRHPWV